MSSDRPPYLKLVSSRKFIEIHVRGPILTRREIQTIVIEALERAFDDVFMVPGKSPAPSRPRLSLVPKDEQP